MRYVEFLDIDVPYAGALGTIEFDPWLAAVASLKTVDGKPMVTHWIDPSPAMSIMENGETKLRDAAHDGVMQSVSGVAPLQKTNAINGQPTFTADEASALGQGTSPDVNADEYTLLAVHNIVKPADGVRYDLFGIGGGSIGTDILFPTLEVGSDLGGNAYITAREGGTTTRRAVGQREEIFGSAAVSRVTFSAERGVGLGLNQEDITSDPSDTRALTTPTFSYLGNRSADNPAIGTFGMAMILRADLNKPEYKGARDIILNGLMAKYGISGTS